MTTRRLAEQVEYSQPVLYSHFKGKDAIMTAVAVEGFADLAPDLGAAREDAMTRWRAVSAAYLSFADRRPALYEAMFSRSVDLPFATPAAPAALQAAFNELVEAIAPMRMTTWDCGPSCSGRPCTAWRRSRGPAGCRASSTTAGWA